VTEIHSDPVTLREVADQLADEAAAFVRRRRAEVFGAAGPSDGGAVRSKSSRTDPVTIVDTETERLLRERLAVLRPGEHVLGEEEGGAAGVRAGRITWVLDPIDGTVNFVYGIPAYAVSLAAEVDGVVVAGVVRNVVTGEEWTAVRGGGAWRDGTRLHGSSVTALGSALVGTGFGYAAQRRREQAEVLLRLLPEIRDIRRIGSAALDLCAAAEGRLDAFFERGLSPWDRAAGGLIAEEAGLLVTGLRGEPASETMTLAAPPAIHAQLHDALVAAQPE